MRTHIIKLSIIAAIAVIVLVAASAITTYFLPVRIPLLSWVGGFMPAAKVGSYSVTFADVRMNTQASKTFYESQNLAEAGIRVDFDTPEGQKRLRLIEKEVLNKLIENAVIEDLVDSVGKRVDPEDVTMELERTLGTGDIEVARVNAGKYGWDLETFAQQIIRPSLYQQRLLALFTEQNGATDEQRTAIADAAKMIEDGRTFAEAAAAYSQGTTAAEGGFEGYFERTQLHPDVASEVFDLEVGVVSEIIETPMGLHLFLVEDERLASDGTRSMIALSQIIIPKKAFGEYLHDQMEARSIRVWMPGYGWDMTSQLAVFDDPELAAYEETLRKELLEALVSASEEQAEGEVNGDNHVESAASE